MEYKEVIQLTFVLLFSSSDKLHTKDAPYLNLKKLQAFPCENEAIVCPY